MTTFNYQIIKGGSTGVEIEEVTPLQLLRHVLLYSGYELERQGIDELLNDERFRNLLRNKGWADVNEAKELEDKKKLTNNFYEVPTTRGGIVREFSLAELKDYQLRYFAEGTAKLVQEVDVKSILNKQQLSLFNKTKREIKKRKEAAKKAAATRAARARDKKIKEAKELLKQEGEL